jgi:hypothetical protein
MAGQHSAGFTRHSRCIDRPTTTVSKRSGQAVAMKRIKEIAETAWATATSAFMCCYAARVGW